MRRVSRPLACALLLAAASAHGAVLVDRGFPRAAIVVAPDAPDSVRYAARELQAYLRQSTGAMLPMRATADPGRSNVYVGESAGTRRLGLSARGLKPDGFRIVSRAGWLAILGRDYAGPPITGMRNPWRYNEVYSERLKLGAFGETGTLYGVYRLLEDIVGVRWYMPGELGTVVPRRPTVLVPPMRMQAAPAYEYRYPWFCNFDTSDADAAWFRRAGFGAPYPAQIIDSFGLFLKHKDAHPEYFALIGGKRDFSNLSTIVGPGNLCLSNPEVARQWVADIDQYFDANPGQSIFPLAPNDGMVKVCECKECQAQVDPARGEAGRFSNYVWTFVDRVARGVALRHPDKFVGCIAYEGYNAPPTRLARLAPNVAVMVCKTRGSYGDPAYARQIRETLAGWARKTANIYCWEYYLYSWPPWRGFPIAFPHTIAADLKRLRGVSRGEFIEAESAPGAATGRLECPAMAHLNLYITGRLLWNPDQDVDALLDEYYAAFYGPARAQMKEFWRTAERVWAARSRLGDPINVYRPSDIRRLSACLERAAARTSPRSDYGRRVELVRSEFEGARRRVSSTLVTHPPRLAARGPVPPVRLDGLLDDAAWQGLEPFGFVDMSGEMASTRTWGYAAWDDANLYLAFLCYEPEMGRLNARASRRDQDYDPGMWDDDSIEVFLYPNAADRKAGYQFIMNSRGLLWDARIGAPSSRPDVAWNGHAAARCRRETNRWVLEVQIPFSDLGLGAPTNGAAVAANFFRNRYCGGPAVYSCWSPTLTTQHANPARAGLVEFRR